MRTRIKKWRPQPARWPMMRSRRASGASASILAAYAVTVPLMPADAKTPGEVHCYKDVCHRVKSLGEMARLVGTEFEQHTSFYDIPERDRMNTGTLTSSGEQFDAWSESHAASSLFPDGTELLLWNPANGRTSHVRVNDFGPFYKRRTLDVTRGVAEKLDFARLGVASLKVFVIWAPDPKSARYRRERIYPPVEGYLGRFDLDQLETLKNRLIAQALPRNGQPPLPTLFAGAKVDGGTVVADLASQPPPDHSLDTLPAFAHPQGEEADVAASIAAINNSPQFTLPAIEPIDAIRSVGPIMFARPTTPTVLIAGASPAAMAAASLAPQSIVARDPDVAVAVASLGPAPAVASSTTGIKVAGVTTAADVVTDMARAAAHGPSSQMWQHLLLTLGMLSAAAATWRTRQLLVNSARGRNAAGELARAPVAYAPPPYEAVPAPPVAANDDRPTATLTYGSVLQLPQLPRRPSSKSDEELRAEAAGLIETFAYRAAEMVLRQLLARREREHGLDHPLTASAERQLADCLRDQGRFAAAEPYYRRALTGMTAAAGDLHPAVADVLDEFAVSLLRQGRAVDARGLARQALAIRRIAGSYTREFAVTLTIIAEANRAEGNLAEAETQHREAWSRFVALSGQTGIDAAASMMTLGAVLAEQDRYHAAEELLNASARVITEACGDGHPASATAYAMLGDLYVRAGQLEAGADMHAFACAIRERVLGQRHPDTVESQLALAIVATGRYQMEEARQRLALGLNGLALGERHPLGPQSRILRQLAELSRHHDVSIEPASIAAE